MVILWAEVVFGVGVGVGKRLVRLGSCLDELAALRPLRFKWNLHRPRQSAFHSGQMGRRRAPAGQARATRGPLVQPNQVVIDGPRRPHGCLWLPSAAATSVLGRALFTAVGAPGHSKAAAAAGRSAWRVTLRSARWGWPLPTVPIACQPRG